VKIAKSFEVDIRNMNIKKRKISYFTRSVPTCSTFFIKEKGYFTSARRKEFLDLKNEFICGRIAR
jgi:hypothetical protein